MSHLSSFSYSNAFQWDNWDFLYQSKRNSSKVGERNASLLKMQPQNNPHDWKKSPCEVFCKTLQFLTFGVPSFGFVFDFCNFSSTFFSVCVFVASREHLNMSWILMSVLNLEQKRTQSTVKMAFQTLGSC